MRSHHLLAAALAVLAFGSTVCAVERDVQDFVYLGDKGPVLMRFHVRIDGKPLVEVWEDFMGKLFAYLDVNGDSVLSKDEASRVPPAQVLFNNVPNFVGQRPNVPLALDQNRDGKVTRAELVEWYRRIGAVPFQTQSDPAQNQFAFVSTVQTQPLPADALNKKLFALLDANKDDKLSRDELARAPSLLHKMDLNEDEMVSVQELSGIIENEEGAFQRIVVAYESEQRAVNGPFVPVKSGAASKELAQRLLNHYGGKAGKTAAKNLTRPDLGIDEPSFKRLDRDEDGKLDREELARFVLRRPDLELHVRLGKKADKEAVIEMVSAKDHPSPLTKAVRRGDNGSLVLELGTTQIELGRGEIANEFQIAVRLRQQYLAQFRMADLDNNGYLDKNEAMRNPLYRNAFRLMDRDSDGKLFEKEITAYLDKMKELQEIAMRSCASLAVKDQGRGLFDLVDANNDGRLGVREMRQMGKLIDRLDRDSDGQISRDEIPHKYRVDVRRGPAQGNQFGSGRVVFVNKMVVNNQPNSPERSGPVWFQKMDRNHDGDVSRREFLGTDEEFRKIDGDGDGLISIEEAKRADQMFRKEKDRKP